MKHRNALRGFLLGVGAAALLATAASAGSQQAPTENTPRPTRVEASKAAVAAELTPGMATVKIRMTDDSARFWTTRAQRGTRGS